MRHEPRMRRGKRHGDRDDGYKPDDRNTGDANLPEHADKLCQLRCVNAERNCGDYDGHLDGKHECDHSYGELGACGLDRVHGEVLVRRKLKG